jgi:hypothetical protein
MVENDSTPSTNKSVRFDQKWHNDRNPITPNNIDCQYPPLTPYMTPAQGPSLSSDTEQNSSAEAAASSAAASDSSPFSALAYSKNHVKNPLMIVKQLYFPPVDEELPPPMLQSPPTNVKGDKNMDHNSPLPEISTEQMTRCHATESPSKDFLSSTTLPMTTSTNFKDTDAAGAGAANADAMDNRTMSFTIASIEPDISNVFSKVEEEAHERRRNYVNHIHDIECRLTTITAKLAEETLDRDGAIQDLYHQQQQQRIELMDYITLERDVVQYANDPVSSSSSSSMMKHGIGSMGWMELERRLALLDAQMTQGIYVHLQDEKRERLDHIQSALRDDIQKVLSIDLTNADHNERNIVRQLENLAGSMSRRYHEECATRVAEIQLLKERVERTFVDHVSHSQDSAMDPEDEVDDVSDDENDDESTLVSSSMVRRKADEIMIAIRDLRQQIVVERAERDAQDRRVVELIHDSTLRMRHAILEAVADHEHPSLPHHHHHDDEEKERNSSCIRRFTDTTT